MPLINKIMNIIIDTSILLNDRQLSKSDISLLKKLSKLNLVKLHFPWIVFKEATSNNYKEISAIINKTIFDFSSLNKKGLGSDEYSKLLKISEELKVVKENLTESVEKPWRSFIEDSKACLHEIDDSHGKIVMSSYFKGDKPFPEPKSRKDIPDAFIYQAILSIKNNVSCVFFICADNNLRNSCSLISGVKVFDSFSSFYDCDEFKAIDIEYQNIEHYAEELVILRKHFGVIKKKAREFIHNDFLSGYKQVISSELIPSDSHEGAIVDIEEFASVEIEENKIKFVDGLFYVPIQMTGKFKIEYSLFKGDFYLIEKTRNINIIESDWDKHYSLV